LCGLLQPVTFKVLFDSVFDGKPASGWVDGAMLRVLPADKVGQIVGLAVIGFGITLVAAVLVMFQTMAAVKVGYYGLRHVRATCSCTCSGSASRTTGPARRATRCTG
jgi:subfamily B ATP-binding cassette protein MsbA